jgi:hypothetical protein
MKRWGWIALSLVGMVVAGCGAAQPTPHTITKENGMV